MGFNLTNNDVLRSLRYILNVSEIKIVQIIELSGRSPSVEKIQAMLLNEDDANYLRCDDFVISHFLDGLIYFKRGKDNSKPPQTFEIPITNNVFLKKLRVAFSLKEEDVLEILAAADFRMSASELSALMRKKDHPNYRECGDQVIRYFLKGLTLRLRPSK